MRIRFMLVLLVLEAARAAAEGPLIGYITIPDEIDRQTSFRGVKFYLDVEWDFPLEAKMLYHLAAIKKIGKLKEPEAFELLRELYAKHADEARVAHFEGIPFYRKQIIEAMAEINTRECREFIYAELAPLLDQGPRMMGAGETRKRKYAWEDGYYASMVGVMLRGMGAWDDERSLEIIGRVCDGAEYSWVIREPAFYAKYKREIRSRKLDGDSKKAIDYLFTKLTGPGVGSKSDFTEDGKTTEALENTGMMRVIQELGPDCLGDLKEKKTAIAQENKPRKLEAIDRAVFMIESEQRNKEWAAQRLKRLME